VWGRATRPSFFSEQTVRSRLAVETGGTPPPQSRSIGIRDLGGSHRQVFGFKGLTGKVFMNQRLKLSKSAENWFGEASRAVLVDRRASKLPQSDLYRCARRGLSQWISITDGWDEKGVCPGPDSSPSFGPATSRNTTVALPTQHPHIRNELECVGHRLLSRHTRPSHINIILYYVL
jgi:hypothetical protein